MNKKEKKPTKLKGIESDNVYDEKGEVKDKTKAGKKKQLKELRDAANKDIATDIGNTINKGQ